MSDHDSLAYQLHQSTLTREAKLVAAENENDDLRGEVARLRAENVALAAALADIAGIYEVDGCWTKPIAECSQFNGRLCHEDYPDGPDEWCSTCVAEVAWCAWKMGALR